MNFLDREDRTAFKIWSKYALITFAALLVGVVAMIFFLALNLTAATLVSLVVPAVAFAAVRAAFQAGRQSERKSAA